MNNEKSGLWIGVVVFIICVLGFSGYLVYDKVFKEKEPIVENEVEQENLSAYSLQSNDLEDFDLYFLKLENNNKNIVYSPLSIKYALEMLAEGANGTTKEQITNILGSYKNRIYENNENRSFANALFIEESYLGNINETFINTLKSKFDAQVLFDSFNTPTVVNNWVSSKTFNLVNNLFDDLSTEKFVLINALAIDMEWVNKIQSEFEPYVISYPHERYNHNIWSLDTQDYTGIKFEGVTYEAKSSHFGADINKYDIINTLGADNIRSTVREAYLKWLQEEGFEETEEEINKALDEYMESLASGYKQINSSTDFSYYVDDDVKVFAKDLKEYNGMTLEYVGIMPIKGSLDNYIINTDAESINILINKLKSIKLENFKDGVITKINGYVPMFNFEYELKLIEDLNRLGIVDVFTPGKADLSNISDGVYINKAIHKANIEFSNDGIKAAAATALGGAGDDHDGFEYLFDVPVEEVDLTFNKPYMFIIRDKATGEVWFTGTVKEPVKFEPYQYEDYEEE